MSGTFQQCLELIFKIRSAQNGAADSFLWKELEAKCLEGGFTRRQAQALLVELEFSEGFSVLKTIEKKLKSHTKLLIKKDEVPYESYIEQNPLQPSKKITTQSNLVPTGREQFIKIAHKLPLGGVVTLIDKETELAIFGSLSTGQGRPVYKEHTLLSGARWQQGQMPLGENHPLAIQYTCLKIIGDDFVQSLLRLIQQLPQIST
jgi:hypothetical protein